MTGKEHIGRGRVVERFVMPVMVVVFNELTDRLFQLPRVVVVFQLDDVLHRTVIAFDLPLLRHRMVGRTACMLQAVRPE